MADHRPTTLTLPLRWVVDGPEDMRLFVGPFHVADIFTIGTVPKWVARSRAWVAHRSDDHPTAEAAQIALELALVEAVGNE